MVTESLRKLNPDIFTRLEGVYDRLDSFCAKHGTAALIWDHRDAQISCVTMESRMLSVAERVKPESIIGYFDANLTYADLEAEVVYYFLQLPSQESPLKLVASLVKQDNAREIRNMALCPGVDVRV